MAIINWAQGADMRGSFGSTTYSNWRGVGTVRRKGYPVRRARRAQPTRRAYLSWVSRQWAIITSAQRAMWKAWATTHPIVNAFGNSVIMPGFQAFMQVNLALCAGFDSTTLPLAEPPVAPPIVTMNSLTAADGAADGEITLDWTLLGTGLVGDKVQVQTAGPFNSPGRVEVFSAFGELINAAGNAVDLDVTGLQVEAYYWFRARYLEALNVPGNWLYVQHQAPDVA